MGYAPPEVAIPELPKIVSVLIEDRKSRLDKFQTVIYCYLDLNPISWDSEFVISASCK